jgi:hypothetical protein
MRLTSLAIVIAALTFFVSCKPGTNKNAQNAKGLNISFVEDSTQNKIDVMIDGSLFTSYQWPEDVYKPILYPILTSAGTEITRGFPIKPRTGERTDHPHQVGLWLTYGNVDGNDFWGNGSEGLGIKNTNGGVIKHLGVEKISGGKGEGVMVTTESWVDTAGIELLKEKTEYHFVAIDSIRIIDRITTLTAGEKSVLMADTKEGMLGIRVARQLELPSNDEITLYSVDGRPETVNALSNEGISGNYLSSEGAKGADVWGKRAKWMDLYGNIGKEKISLVLCDHPKNISYPSYWHARGYGLFAVNPFGLKDFTEEKEELNFSIAAGSSTTLRYRIIVSSGAHLSDAEINAFADAFAKKY